MKTFQRLESNVRGYCRAFPTIFKSASGSILTAADGREYIDFFAGAGSLNYGHNPPALKRRLIEYIENDGVTHALDMATAAKENFLLTFEEVVLQPRDLEYKVMFPGPTGTNSVEAALKLARKVTGRHNVVAFTNAFHGMTLGSLALTGNSGKRAGAGVPLNNVTHMFYCDYLGTENDTIDALRRHLEDSSSGMDHPAAIILETVQAEGGVNVASRKWLVALAELAREFDVLFIVDDIQVGCGRTGPFFSFETYGIEPDIICLSKSLSGYGLPFAVTLMKPELDEFAPGEHNGTFRGHNPAFVTAAGALDEYWRDDRLSQDVKHKAKIVRDVLLDLADEYDAELRGRGLIQGLDFSDGETAAAISAAAFERGLIIETAGPGGQVVKLLPPLTIEEEQLRQGLKILSESVDVALGERRASVEQTVT